MMSDRRSRTALELLVDGGEAVARVRVASIVVACAAVIKVGTIEALVSYTVNHLVTAIALGSVSEVAASREKSLLGERKASAIDSRLEVMGRVMAVVIAHVACEAKVKVIALETSDKVAVWEGNDTGIACAVQLGQSIHVVVESFRSFLGRLSLGLGCRRSGALRGGSKSLGGAADDLAILDEPLDQPVAVAKTGTAVFDTSLAEIKVTTITHAAMVVNVVHDSIASVAEDGPWSSRHVDRLGNTQGESVWQTLSSSVCSKV
jgi:hypothetical protein